MLMPYTAIKTSGDPNKAPILQSPHLPRTSNQGPMTEDQGQMTNDPPSPQIKSR
jgi:hypothetical protein